MAQNILYRPYYHKEIKIHEQSGRKNKIETISELGSGFCMKYGIPSDDTREVSSYQDFLHIMLGYESGYYGNKNKRYGYYIESGRTRIYEQNFVSAKEWFTYEKIELKDIRMEYLIKSLNADEFVRFMNDNIHVMKGMI